MQKPLSLTSAIGLALSLTAAQASDASAAGISGPNTAPVAQQSKKTCNAQAQGKKGDERKAFMRDCLRAK